MKKRIFMLFVAVMVLACLFTSCVGNDSDDTAQNGTENGTDQTPNANTHTHTPTEAVKENEIAPTCNFIGGYDSVVYCSECGEELSREKEIIEKLEHTPADAVRENVVDPTCVKMGGYDSVVYCSECNCEIERTAFDLPKTEHIPKEAVKENTVDPTCLIDGSYDSVVYCSLCKNELSREQVVIEHTGHTSGEPVEENYIAPTCVNNGSKEYAVYCSVCSEELSRNTEIIIATGHTEVDNTCTRCGAILKEENSLEYALSDDGTYYIVTGIGSCKDQNLVIPEEYKGLPVGEIGNYAFKDCTQLKTVHIPATVKRLGWGAAWGCTNLQKITLEDINGWEGRDGHEATSGISVPVYFLQNTSPWMSYITAGDQYWLIKVK